MNSRGAGRPVNRLELHLNDISKFKQDVLSVCQNKNTKELVWEVDKFVDEKNKFLKFEDFNFTVSKLYCQNISQ